MSNSEEYLGHPATWTEEQLTAACEFQFNRRGGPGGQHRNKVETAVAVTHLPTGIQAEAHEARSQAENRRVALFRVRLKLAVEHRAASEAVPSALWISRRSANRIKVANNHRDFPALLAEALNVIVEKNFVVSEAAERLKITPSQLIGLLRQHPPALAVVNAARIRLEKRPFK